MTPFDDNDSLTFSNTCSFICDKCTNKSHYISRKPVTLPNASLARNLQFCEQCYNSLDKVQLIRKINTNQCINCTSFTCKLSTYMLDEKFKVKCLENCDKCETNNHILCPRCENKFLTLDEILNILMHKVTDNDILYSNVIIDTSPRHQDISHVPLELLEKNQTQSHY